MLQPLPPEEAAKAEVLRGPNIKPFPKGAPVTDTISAELVLKVGDNITTDHIMPAGANLKLRSNIPGSKVLPYRSNIPKMSEFCFEVCDPDFPARAKAAGQGIILGGSNYGQGSSREHAALVPMYLGIRAVVTKSFARIHVANLINAGILPLTFKNEEDYALFDQGGKLTISGILTGMNSGTVTMTDEKGHSAELNCVLTERQKAILLAGGLLAYTKEGGK